MTREEVKQICQIYDNLRRERDAATIVYNSNDTFWDHVLTTYNLSQPSLPSNLDEAAEKYEEEYGNYLYGLSTAFKAGAEWMAGQGQTFEAKATRKYERSLSGFVSYLVGDEAGAIHKLINLGEEADVIIQIRKKQ